MYGTPPPGGGVEEGSGLATAKATAALACKCVVRGARGSAVIGFRVYGAVYVVLEEVCGCGWWWWWGGGMRSAVAEQ